MRNKIIPVVALILFSISSAYAAKPQSVMIHTNIIFGEEFTGNFTATPPLCSSGVFITTQSIFNPSQFHGHGFMAEKQFVCDDDTGTFNVQFHPLSQGSNDPEFILTGPWSVVNGGIGAYVKLTGHGDFGVVIDFDQDPWIGEETFVGSVQFK